RKAPDAVIRAATVKGRKLYRVSVPGFERKSEALDYKKSISHELGLKGVWIERNKSSRKSPAKH
ncbi:SPOR domain-containing protein, partial [Thiolapillus sp.]